MLRDRLENDVEAGAEDLRRALRRLRSRATGLGASLLASGRQPMRLHMTGSGSTLFVPAADAETVGAVAAALQPLQQQGVRLLAVRSLARLPEPEPAEDPGGGG